MLLNSFLFKQKARASLKGNWQTALVVTFFSGVFHTVAKVLESVTTADIRQVTNSITSALSAIPEGAELSVQQAGEVTQLYRHLFASIESVPQAVWIGMIVVNLLSILLTPALSVSCCRYFVCRNRGEELGVKDGLLSRMPIWGKSLWLYVRMYAQVFLWSLLFIIPGIIAALRYSMAPYFLAEDPSLKAKEAIQKSKEVMKNKKFSFLMLMVSFVWWSLTVSVVQMLLQPMLGPVITLVLAQFLSLWVSTYINAAYASFYCAVSHPDGMDDLMNNMRDRMRQMGMSDSDIREAGFGSGKTDGQSDGEDELQ